VDLTAWKVRELKVSSLSLDPQNPRIPEFGAAPTVRQIIASLIKYEDVLELAKNIVQFGGLYPSEALIGIEDNGDKVVVEGNRRLAALKLLDSPEMAPESYVSRFRAQKELISPQTIEKAHVVFAPSREAAAPLIVSRHTRGAVKAWLPGQQAKYIRTLVGPDHPIEDIAKRINISETDILKNLRVDTMLQVARIMPLPDQLREMVADPRQIPVSVVERFIESKAAQHAFGFQFDGDGNLVGDIDEGEFKKGFTRFLIDVLKPVSDGGIDTRTLNTKSDIQNYLNGLGSDKPDKRKKGVFTSASLLSGKTASANAAGKAAVAKTAAHAAPRDSAYLVPKEFRCTAKAPRVKETFRELRRLKVTDFPNTCGVMVRIFFEMLVTHYLDETSKMKLLVQELLKKKTIKTPNEYHPSMTEMMMFLMADQAIIITAQARKVINRMVSDKHSLLSFDDMNAFVHNIHLGPNEKELRRLWSMLQPLMKQLMV
jgi:hypothetical protein